jgi:chromosome transmission fidelity protein 4
VLDLVKMLHHTASYDMAAKVAGFYHLIGLQEKIEMLKADREEGGDDGDEYGVDPREVARRRREQWRREGSGAVPPPRPDGESSRSAGYNGAKKAFQDFGPPPAIHRPGLTRAGGGLALSQPSKTPGPPSSSLANGSGSSYREGSPPNDVGSFDWEEEQSMSVSTAGLINEGKRKRANFDELMMDTFDASNEGAKRRALGQPKAS